MFWQRWYGDIHGRLFRYWQNSNNSVTIIVNAMICSIIYSEINVLVRICHGLQYDIGDIAEVILPEEKNA